jgi:DNA-binding transcriptional ArsR family regulator
LNATVVTGKTKKKAAARPAESPIRVSEKTIKDLTAVFKLLADKHRLKIVLALAHEGEMHVTALKDLLKQSQPAISHHLTLMRTVGLVDFTRKGKNNFYYLASSHLRDLLDQFFADTGNGHKAIQFAEFALTYRRK